MARGRLPAGSRRITEEHRLVYRVVGDDLQILRPATTTVSRSRIPHPAYPHVVPAPRHAPAG
nr:type II toxin-antitoxin system YoeB family toxin [Mycobacterium marseillense]